MSARTINVLLTRQGVNMGDHAQDVTRSLDVSPDTTLGALVESALTKPTWRAAGDSGPADADPDAYLTIRIAAEERAS